MGRTIVFTGWRDRMLALGMLMLLIAVGCERSASRSAAKEGSGTTRNLTGRLTLTGSSTVAPLIAEIAKRFEADYPGVRIDVQTGGSSRGIADAIRATADLGMASRDLSETEARRVNAHPIARDGVVMVVHASNPVNNLTDSQIRRIFTGRIDNWSAVGGPDAPITVINRAEGRAELKVVAEHLDITPADFHADLVSGENQHAVKSVASNRHAIIYLSAGFAAHAIQHGEPIKRLAWNGIAPTADNLAADAFPVSRPLNLIAPPEPGHLALAFVNYASSEAVSDLVRKYRYVPIRAE